MHHDAPGRQPAWVERFLRIPLFFKIVLANTVLLSAVALVAAPLLGAGAREAWIVGAWVAGIVAVISVNGALVHLALRPLRNVEETARRVEAGDTGARVPPSPLADRELDRVTHVLNRMLDSLEAARRQQMELAARVLEAEETERSRIAHELFGDTAQLLSATLLQVQLAGRVLEREAPPGAGFPRTEEALEVARGELLSALQGLQRIARGLRPPELDELGPIAALEVQARHLARESGVEILFEDCSIDSLLDARTGVALYRILREGLANAIAHAHPSKVRIAMHLDEDRIHAELADDGEGFDPTRVREHPERHVGVLRMQERARHAGGILKFHSRPGRGTRLVLSFPRRTSPSPAADALPDGAQAPATGTVSSA